MKYTMKAHPTTYAGVNFRSRLEARWAAFFNCMKWTWQYEPVDLAGWSPDFRLRFNEFDLLVEIKPYFEIAQFRTHPCWTLGAGFGIEPNVSRWELFGNVYTLKDVISRADLEAGWAASGNLTQWKKKKRKKV